MLDINFIRENKQKVVEAAQNKQIKVDIDKLLTLDEARRSIMSGVEQLRASRNQLSQGSTKPTEKQIDEGKKLKTEITAQEAELKKIDNQYLDLLKQVPNLATDDTPVGASEEDNQVVYEWGDKPNFDFKPRTHWQIGEDKGWIDKERAAKVAGARFAYVKGDLALLQMAIISFTTAKLTDEAYIAKVITEAGIDGLSTKPYSLVLPPLMIRTEVFDAMDRLEPRDDRYKLENEDLWLQGSAEHVLGSMYMDEVIAHSDMPVRMLGHATSFRREAGAYGKDTEGIIRMHQFDKLEMEALSNPETSLNEHLLTVAIQENLMRELGIPYRKLLKCTADIGKPNARGVDLDAWLPGHGGYKETHTADYMTDYQARRLATRFKRDDGSVELVHTIDATAFALGRTMVAIIENFQQADGSVRIPEALRPFMAGREAL